VQLFQLIRQVPHERADICGDWLLGSNLELAALTLSGMTLANHVLLAIIGLVNALRQRFEKTFSVLHLSNMALAIGSMLYHATLQRV
jgi:hypothetical protein